MGYSVLVWWPFSWMKGGGGIKLFIDIRRAVNRVKTFHNDLVAIFIFFDMAK